MHSGNLSFVQISITVRPGNLKFLLSKVNIDFFFAITIWLKNLTSSAGH